jgi:hypothetical protein
MRFLEPRTLHPHIGAHSTAVNSFDLDRVGRPKRSAKTGLFRNSHEDFEPCNLGRMSVHETVPIVTDWRACEIEKFDVGV